MKEVLVSGRVNRSPVKDHTGLQKAREREGEGTDHMGLPWP